MYLFIWLEYGHLRIVILALLSREKHIIGCVKQSIFWVKINIRTVQLVYNAGSIFNNHNITADTGLYQSYSQMFSI